MENSYTEKQNPDLVLTVNQVKGIFEEYVPYKLNSTYDRKGFEGAYANIGQAEGLLCVNAAVSEDKANLRVTAGLVRGISDSMLSAQTVLDYMIGLGEKASIVKLDNDIVGLSLKIKAEPLSVTRVTLLKNTIGTMIDFAHYLQEVAGQGQKKPALLERYKDVRSDVEPVFPFSFDAKEQKSGITGKSLEVIGLLESGICVALSCEHAVMTDFFMAVIAGHLQKRSIDTLGISREILAVKSLLSINGKAPGYLGVRSISLGFVSGPYERADEIDIFLSILKTEKKPILFFGSYAQHQSVFGSGQGKPANPLYPAIVSLAFQDIEREDLIRFTLKQEIAKYGLAKRSHAETIYSTINCLFQEGRLRTEELDYLSPLIKSILLQNENPLDVIALLRSRKETFRGISNTPVNGRSDVIQAKLVEGINKGSLRAMATSKLIGQDKAIDIAVGRLWKEVLTRSLNQPIRMIFQGVAGVGKSEFCQIVADYLDVPFVSIDASSFSDIHQASSMLLGSGRGIVQSYLPGKLEVIAKHPGPVCCEIADMDHTPHTIRGYLADMFLNMMERGEVQIATGEKVCINNVILFFTINLPFGMDEQVTRGLGFNSMLSYEDVLIRTTKEIKTMFSGAFVSRVGQPILFKPIDDIGDQASILELAIRKKLGTCLINLGITETPPVILLEEGTGLKLMTGRRTSDRALGVRVLYDLAGELVTSEVLDNIEFLKTSANRPIRIKPKDNSEISITF